MADIEQLPLLLVPKDGAQDKGKGVRKEKRDKETGKERPQQKSKTKDKSATSPVAPFPKTTFENALAIGLAIQQHGAGQKMRRTTLFEKLNKSPESGPSRAMVTNSSKYGITIGGYRADFIELTELGQKATNPESPQVEKAKARLDLAINSIKPFAYLYEANKGKRIPSREVMRDSLAEISVPEVHRKECVDLFLENAKYLGLLRVSAGAERLMPIEQILEELSEHSPVGPISPSSGQAPVRIDKAKAPAKKVCFLIAPIGQDGTEERKHSDMVLESLIDRALEGEDFDIVRADRIGDPGMISEQVIKYLLHSDLVIADLSFHNPNVFYELAIRHLIGRPTVHIIRREDQIPFDVKDFRTILIDTRDKYELVAKLDTYRAEIANHVRMALASGIEGSNPITVFAKGLVVELRESQ
jgi:hypothetical protein